MFLSHGKLIFSLILTFLVFCTVVVNLRFSLNIHEYTGKREKVQANKKVFLNEVMPKFEQLKRKILNQFYERYGGEEKAYNLYLNGMITYPLVSNRNESINFAANRLLKHIELSKPFRLSFAGYSVTAGRGNWFNQSYPLLLEAILSPLFDLIELPFAVRNNAIGATPQFPYGWCLQNFLLNDSSVISWDFSEGEGESGKGLEAFIRQISVNFDKPMIIVLDRPFWYSRKRLLPQYIEKKLIAPDSLILKHDFRYIPTDMFKMNVSGLYNWTRWGTPDEVTFGKNGPGGLHPTLGQHELLAWILAVHFLLALDTALHMYTEGILYKEITASSFLPPPLSVANYTGPSYFFGTQSNSNSSLLVMNQMLCYTSFQPNLLRNLSTIVTRGASPNVSTDIYLDPTHEHFSQGWVYGLNVRERAIKRNLTIYNNFNIPGKKLAYLGTPESGTLQLRVPLFNADKIIKKDILRSAHNNYYVKDFVRSLLICHFHEKPFTYAGKPENHMKVYVGTVNSNVATRIWDFSSLKRLYFAYQHSACLDVEIIDAAHLTFEELGKKLSLNVEIEVIGNVSMQNGPCSVSHVVLELTTLLSECADCS